MVLPPLPPTQSSDLVIEGETTLLIRNVAVGNVWLLSGQSNMEWPLAKTVSADGKARAAMRPWLRHLEESARGFVQAGGGVRRSLDAVHSLHRS